ncbi:MAG: hypothetical protein AB8B66_00155 [Rickettsiaceae bacterium]
MRVNELPQDALNALQTLVDNGVVDVNSPEVQNSMFYQRIQNQLILTFTAGIDPALLLFMTQIVATSPSLGWVTMSGYNLGEHGPATAAALAASNTIQKINIRSNQLGEHGPATEAVFADRNNAAQALINELLETNREHDLFPDDLMNLIGEYVMPLQHIELLI